MTPGVHKLRPPGRGRRLNFVQWRLIFVDLLCETWCRGSGT